MSEPLLNEIRKAKPTAPESLRERVRALPAPEPARAPFLDRFRFPPRHLLLAVPATVFVAVLAAGVIGLSRDGVSGQSEAGSAGSGGVDTMCTR